MERVADAAVAKAAEKAAEKGAEKTAAATSIIPHAAQPLSRREAALWGLGLAAGSAGLGALLSMLSGRF